MNDVHAATQRPLHVAEPRAAPAGERSLQLELDQRADVRHLLVAHRGRAHFQFRHTQLAEQAGDRHLFCP